MELHKQGAQTEALQHPPHGADWRPGLLNMYFIIRHRHLETLVTQHPAAATDPAA
jgi:hypothetical protein